MFTDVEIIIDSWTLSRIWEIVHTFLHAAIIDNDRTVDFDISYH